MFSIQLTCTECVAKLPLKLKRNLENIIMCYFDVMKWGEYRAFIT